MLHLPVDPTTPQAKEDVRKAQCFYRTDQRTCARVDTLLGWKDGMTLDECDQCWDKGGPNTQEGEMWCWERANRIAEIWKDPKNVRRAKKEVLVALTVHHLDPDERRALVEREDFKTIVKGSGMWARVRKTWEVETIKSFFKSMASRALGGKVAAEVKAKRWESCSGLDVRGQQVRPPCIFFKTALDGEHHFCGACGCGSKETVYLDRDEGGYSKLDYPHLECPLEEEGFSNERPPG